jgi:hypothetical protein
MSPISANTIVARRAAQCDAVADGAFIVSLTTRTALDHFPYFATVQFVPEPPAPTLVGACGGPAVALGQPVLGVARCTVGHRPTTPPAANGALGGRSPAVRAAFWPGCAGGQGTNAVASAARRPRSVLARRAAVSGAAQQLREARRAPGKFSL